MKTILITILALALTAQAVDQRPIIGILTEPSDYSQYPASKYTYMAASYVKYVEMAGGQAVPIPFDATQDYLEDLMSKLNGVLLPGGGVDFESSTDEIGKLFLKNSQFIINKAIEFNDNGDSFPVWGTCMGFQLLHYVVSGLDSRALKSGVAEFYQNNTVSYDPMAELYKGMSDEISLQVRNGSVIFYDHNSYVDPQFYKENEKIRNFFNITGLSTFNNITYIASMEAKNYPIYGTQYHPEKNVFEWLVDSPHNLMGTLTTQYFANFFVEKARASQHQFSDDDLAKQIIYNYNPVVVDGAHFSQIYFFDRFQQEVEEEVEVKSFLE